MTISFNDAYLLPESDDVVADSGEAVTLHLSELHDVINDLTSHVTAAEDVHNGFHEFVGEHIVVLIVKVVALQI
jgi:hypothetical protein